MWWHRKAWRVWVPLFVILLLLVCLAELGQDARWNVLKCNEIDICKTLYNFLNGDARENIDRGNMTNRQRNTGRVEVSWYSSGKLCKQASNVPASYQTFELSPATSRDFTLNASKDLSIVTLWPSLPDKLYSFFSLHALKIPKPTDHVAPTLNSPIASSSWASLAQLKNLPSVSTAASLRRVLVQDPEETIPQPSHSAPTPVEHSTSIYSPSPLSFPSISRLSPLTKHSLSNSLFLVQGSKLWKQYVWNPAQSSSMTRLLASIPAIDKSLGNLFIAKESLQFSAWSPTSNMKLRMLKSLHFKLSASSSISPSPAVMPAVPLVQHSPLSSRHRYHRHSHRRQRKPPSGVIYPPTRSPISAPLPLGPSSPPSHRGHHRVPRSVPAPAPTSQGPTPNPGTHLHPHPPRSRHAKSPRYPPSHSPRSRHAKSPRYPSSGPDLAPSRAPAPHLAKPPMTLPSPSAGQDCARLPCPAPLTETPLGSPCGCVLPIQVELELGVALYALFPLIAVLAEEIAEGTLLLQSEVRIMGANSNNQDQDKSIVDINLVPLGETFDNLTALLIFQKFWNHEVRVNETLFGNYTVIYVRYPGLPPSPPSNYGGTVGSPGLGGNEQPLGVNVKKKSDELGGGTIAVIALSSAIAVVVCLGSIWFILLKCSYPKKSALETEPAILSSLTKRSGGGSILSSDIASSTSLSFVSSMATYAGSAKTFTFAELERATNKFHPHNIVGEGGFGRVYRGVLDDGTKVAVKVLTRDDQQGGREFVAEVEMLSRLHHRNLVKLIGICTEEHSRCLVYELIPNGSVESHLHGTDKETAPLDWDARMKIALGAARGLAYLHEDSNPRVIHRDFKASNILLEEDFTPKVSDFGLAKAAPDESSEHISTRVMGTFGYVAPEYAMTGHLLVKSDVYSYGVVLLELLSGRKPVDMSQPPGQENLVTWARPLLTNKESLEMLVDPTLGNNFPFDNMARVAAIASMCVQPEVSYRPFMGEVVQALKLVYNDFDVSNGVGSANGSQEGESISHESAAKSGQPWESSGTPYAPDSTSFVSMDYDSGPVHERDVETQRPLSASALLSGSGRLIRQLSDSFRRHSTSGPLSTRSKPAWYRVIGVERGSISEHALARHFGTGFDRDFYELWP